jgi:hypothetical protein
VPPEALINGLVRCRYSRELQSSVVRVVITQKKILTAVAQGALNLRGTNYTPSPAEYHHAGMPRPLYIADMQFEYMEAVAGGRDRVAKWISIRGHLLAVWNGIYALLTSGVMNLLRKGRGGELN